VRCGEAAYAIPCFRRLAPMNRVKSEPVSITKLSKYMAFKWAASKDDGMTHWKIGLGLCAVLVWGVSVPAASGQQLNQQQIQIIRDTAASICNTVKEARGQKSDVQIQGDVKAQLNGLVGKVVDVGGSGKGSITREEFEGLSREATATALGDDRSCRERLFNKMFDKLSFEPAKPREDQEVTEEVARARAKAQAAAARGREARDNAVRAVQMAAYARQREAQCLMILLPALAGRLNRWRPRLSGNGRSHRRGRLGCLPIDGGRGARRPGILRRRVIRPDPKPAIGDGAGRKPVA
jgi:hypothetical protein